MEEFAKIEREGTEKKGKPKWGLKKLIPLWLLTVAAGTLGLIYWDFHKANEENDNARWETGYYFRINETTSPFTKEILTAAKFAETERAYVSFEQQKFLRGDYYCVDDKGKDSNAPDGLADKVKIGISRKRFIRENDYNGNEKLFHEADQYIALTKKRIETKFSEHID